MGIYRTTQVSPISMTDAPPFVYSFAMMSRHSLFYDLSRILTERG